MRRWGIARFGRIARAAIVLTSAALLSGCFQPLYSSRPAAGNAPSIRDSLSAIDVKQIRAREGSPDAFLAVQVRNDLLFDFTGGGEPPPPAYRLTVEIGGSLTTLTIDRGTALPSAERYILNASYSLLDIAANKTVVTGRLSTYAAFEATGTQRFARVRALRDAQRRAAKQISNGITTRLASFFVAGT